MTPRPFFALVLFALLSPTLATAQSPWVVTVTSGLNPLPIPFCSSVRVDVVDSRTGQRPRNPAGSLMGSADFDMTVTSADPRAMAGQPADPNNFIVCACLAGKAGAVGTITATYPAARLAPRARSAEASGGCAGPTSPPPPPRFSSPT